MSEEPTQEQLEQVKKAAQAWVDNLKLSGNHDAYEVSSRMRGRTFEGQPVLSLVVNSPAEAEHALVSGAVVVEQLMGNVKAQRALKHSDRNAALYQTNGDLYDQVVLHFGDKATESELDAVAKTIITRTTKQLLKLLPKETVNVLADVTSCIWDYYFMAFYEAGTSCIPSAERPEALQDHNSLFGAFQQGLGFILDFGNLVVGVTMPEVHLDNEQRLHRENGPAVSWGKDEFTWWHGTEVPTEWIEDKESVDPQLALTWENIEQRRCLAEILGWDRILELLSPRVIDTQPTPGVEGGVDSLLEVELEGSAERFLRCTCGTKRIFAIPVPPTVSTANEAVKWTYGLDIKDNYAPEIRT
jgi:hypothetical protein